MKTAIYIEDGTVQLVLTPETPFEKSAIEPFGKRPLEATVFSGTFYDCRGGWIRQRDYFHPSAYGDNNDKSVILRIAAVDAPVPETV